MPIVDDFGETPDAGEPEGEGTGTDPFAIERDLLQMREPPWKPVVATVLAVALGFGVAHAILLADKEKNKLVGETLAQRDHQRAVGLSGAGPVGEEVVHVPAGPFTMGRPEDDEETNSDATPEHQVYVPDFYIGKYEVTNAQYQDFVQAVGYLPPPHWKGKTTFPEGTGNLPVTYVGQPQAAAYAKWRDGRLCSEEEWEKAARGTDKRLFPYGNEYDPSLANIDYLQDGLTPVGHFPGGAGPYGALDMMGNVYEWTANRYRPYPGNRDDPAHYQAYKVDASGNVVPDPDQASYYVVTRGGCWKCDPWSSQVTTRNPTRPNYASDFFGFRVCWDKPPEKPAPEGTTP